MMRCLRCNKKEHHLYELGSNAGLCVSTYCISENGGHKAIPLWPIVLEGYDSRTPPLDAGGIEHSLANI